MFSVGLRGLTMLGKFVVLIVVGRYISAADLGTYGLMFATVTTSLMLLGLRFDLFTTRELCTVGPEDQGRQIRDQFAFQGILYLLLLPLGVLLFVTGALEWQLILPFYALLVLEHISNEISRLLLPLRKPIHSNFLMFMRNGMWIYILALLMMFRPEFRKLEYIWWFWGGSAFLSILVGSAWLYGMVFKGYKVGPIDWAWIKRGFYASIIFCSFIFLFNGILTIDRHFLDEYAGKELVGVYTFFITISNIIPTVAETGAALVLFPQMFSAYAANDFDDYRAKKRQFVKSVGLSMAFTTLAAAAVIWPATFILKESDRHLYQGNIAVYGVLLLTGIFAALGHVPHYDLYARGKERILLLCNVLGFVVALILHFALVPRMGLMGTAIATTSAFGVLLVSKIYFASAIPLEPHRPRRGEVGEVALEYES